MIQLKQIGVVHNNVQTSHRDTSWQDIESTIVIDDEWREALDGIAEFSHIWVIFFLDRASPPDSPRVHPMRRADLPLVGRFATRAPTRPNSIGICAVQLLEVRDTRLSVRGLDALEGTPVLDLKPYLEHGDAIRDTRVAEWVRQSWATYKSNEPSR